VHDLSCISGCMRFVAYADDVPLLSTLRTSAVIGAPMVVGDTTTRERTDQDPRSDVAPRRAPPSRRSGCLSPPRHAKELVRREGIAPFGLRAGSLAHAAHTLPQAGDSVFDGHCEATVRSPADPWQFESTGAFLTRWDFRAWD